MKLSDFVTVFFGAVAYVNKGLTDDVMLKNLFFSGCEDPEKMLRAAKAVAKAKRQGRIARCHAVGLFREVFPRGGTADLAEYWGVPARRIHSYLDAYRGGEVYARGGSAWADLTPSLRLLRLPFSRASEAFL